MAALAQASVETCSHVNPSLLARGLWYLPVSWNRPTCDPLRAFGLNVDSQRATASAQPSTLSGQVSLMAHCESHTLGGGGSQAAADCNRNAIENAMVARFNVAIICSDISLDGVSLSC